MPRHHNIQFMRIKDGLFGVLSRPGPRSANNNQRVALWSIDTWKQEAELWGGAGKCAHHEFDVSVPRDVIAVIDTDEETGDCQVKVSLLSTGQILQRVSQVYDGIFQRCCMEGIRLEVDPSKTHKSYFLLWQRRDTAYIYKLSQDHQVLGHDWYISDAVNMDHDGAPFPIQVFGGVLSVIAVKCSQGEMESLVVDRLMLQFDTSVAVKTDCFTGKRDTVRVDRPDYKLCEYEGIQVLGIGSTYAIFTWRQTEHVTSNTGKSGLQSFECYDVAMLRRDSDGEKHTTAGHLAMVAFPSTRHR